MSKKQKHPVSYDHVTPKLLAQVNGAIKDADKHKYSVSRVYGAYNAALLKNDKHEACASCLRNRVAALRAWARGYAAQLPKVEGAPTLERGADESVYDFLVRRLSLAIGDTPGEELATLNTVLEVGELTDEETDAVLTRIGELERDVTVIEKDPNNPQYPAPVLGVTRFPMGEGLVPVDFTTEDGSAAVEGSKGRVRYASGDNVRAGTITTASGHEIAVQPGGKATIKAQDLT